MPESSQHHVLEFLKTSALTGRPQDRARCLSTHISFIVLRGGTAWKLKRALALPYLNFSTAEQRLAACVQEVELNRRTAPGLYLGAHRITREADGRLALDGQGPLVDAVVKMRRFDDGCLLSEHAATGGLDEGLLGRLADHIAGFHRSTPAAPVTDGAARMAGVLSLGEQAEAMVPIFGKHATSALHTGLREGLARHAALLDARAHADLIRRCHGDLHLGNICLLDGEPLLFDCLEFNETLATIDVLYDIAFLLMDLWQRGLRAQANWVMNRYFDVMDAQVQAPTLLSWFMALRASIRAQVLATQIRLAPAARSVPAGVREQAQAYLELALSLMRPAQARLVAIGGLSGTGKSTVAARVAPQLEPAPGARVLSSDRIRKHMAGVPVLHRLPAESYTPESSQAVYAALLARAEETLAAGGSVVADAVFNRAEARAAIARCARQAGLPFEGIWLHASPDTLLARVDARRNDPSDATAGVVEIQLQGHRPPEDWIAVAAGGKPGQTAAAVLESLDL